MLPVSLDCPFTLPLRYSLTCICPVSCVSYVASFSGLFFFITPSVFSNMYLSWQIHVREYRRGNEKGQSRETGNIGYTRQRMPVSLDCPFSLPLRYSLTCICPVSYVSYFASFSGLFFYIAPSVFSNRYLSWQIHVREYRRGNVKGQSRETGNIGYTRHRTNTC
jgi:uncharacterized membrane protein YesL